MRPILLGLWGALLWCRPFISDTITPRLSALLQLALLALSLALCMSPARPPPPTPRLFWPLGLLGGTSLMAILTAPESSHAAVVWLEVMAAAAVVPVLWRCDPRETRWLLLGFLVGALVISAFALLQYVDIFPRLAQIELTTRTAQAIQEVATRRRVFGTFPLPNFLAGYLGIMMPLAVGLLVQGPRRGVQPILAVISLLAMGAAFLLAQSLGAVLAVGVACALVLARSPGGRRWWLLWFATTVVLIATLVAVRPMLREFAHAHNPFRNRLAYWQVTASIIREHPFRGVGLGGFEEAYRAMRPPGAPRVIHAHNSYGEGWAEMGLVGFLAWLWVVWEVVRSARRRSGWLAIAAWAFALHNAVDATLYISQVNVLWWVVAGLASGDSPRAVRFKGVSLNEGAVGAMKREAAADREA